MKLHYPLKDIGIAPGVYLTQKFGQSLNDYSQFGMKGHNGIDWGAPLGTPVLAAHAGYLYQNPKDPDGYGIYARIKWEEDGVIYDTVYGHFQKHEGRERYVKTGEIIGYVNSSGFSTGNHLHFGLRLWKDGKVLDYNNGYLGYIDPVKYFTMNQTKVVKSDKSDTVYICYPVPTWQHLEERASLEGFDIPTDLPSASTLP